MKNIILSICVCVLFVKCSDKEDYFLKNSDPISIYLTLNGIDYFNDEIKDTIKIGYNSLYEYKDTNIVRIAINKTYGSGSLIEKDGIIEISSNEVGNSIFSVSGYGIYDNKVTIDILLNVFDNLLPVTLYDIKSNIVGAVSPYEIEIDASKSYDQDNRFGGKIILYEYSIGNNYKIESTLNKIHYIFNSAGQKQITVRVKDNNNVWSNEKTEYITIN